MAEQKREKLYITLRICEETIQVWVDREDEEYYRSAAKYISERIGRYKQLYGNRKATHVIEAMTMLDIALKCQKLSTQNDTKPYDDILDKLSAEIKEALA